MTGINPVLAQGQKITAERKQQIDSIRQLQWAIWDKDQAKKEAERKKWIRERTLREKDPLYQKIISRNHYEDSLRRAGYDIMLDKLGPDPEKLELSSGNYKQIPDQIYLLEDLD
ncbi:MAG: hypothetical protein KFF73_14510, partial [Cyclobacteriaceae bacterium]|nr:hypothetical protein [Cyclobacteriaceae bacterium]